MLILSLNHEYFVKSCLKIQLLIYVLAAPEVTPYKASTYQTRKHGNSDNPMCQRLTSAGTSEEIINVLEKEADKMDPIIMSVAVEALFDAIKTESLVIRTKK